MCLSQVWTKKNFVRTQAEKKLKLAIAQGIVAVLDGRDYVRLCENVWFVIAITFILFEIK